MTASRRGTTLALVLVLINVPALLALIEAASFYSTNRSTGSFISSGRERSYVLHVPNGYDPARPTPLVISMHGAGLWGAAQRDISGWNAVADREGFIVVYPSGAGRAAPRVWRVRRGDGLARDVRFIAELIDTLSARYNIDAARIYANGLSNGGGMAFVLSCTLSHRIAAVGMVAAAQTLAWEWCSDGHPVPMIAFHGTADPVIPYEGGTSWVGPNRFPDVPTWVRNWARRNGCAPTPGDSPVALDVTRRAYGNCAANSDVVLYTVLGGGHSWPGGGALPGWLVGSTSRSIDASAEMWAFFKEHRLER